MIETPTVVFIDVLGFARQVVKDDKALGLLDAFYNSSHSFEQLNAHFRSFEYTVGIERLFGLFHVGLEEEIAQALKASHLHSIVFSDSAFVAFEHPADALLFCQTVMRKMISGRVPVRIGVGHGSFRPLRFKTDLAQDITLHSSYFLGTGVVNAYAAEKSGVSGLRILLHKDFPIPSGFDDVEVLSLIEPTDADSERIRRFRNAIEVVDRELTYLHPHIPLRALPDDFVENDRINDMNNGLLSNVLWLRSQAQPEFHFQYDHALQAIERMRQKLKLPIFKTDVDV